MPTWFWIMLAFAAGCICGQMMMAPFVKRDE